LLLIAVGRIGQAVESKHRIVDREYSLHQRCAVDVVAVARSPDHTFDFFAVVGTTRAESALAVRDLSRAAAPEASPSAAAPARSPGPSRLDDDEREERRKGKREK